MAIYRPNISEIYCVLCEYLHIHGCVCYVGNNLLARIAIDGLCGKDKLRAIERTSRYINAAYKMIASVGRCCCDTLNEESCQIKRYVDQRFNLYMPKLSAVV